MQGEKVVKKTEVKEMAENKYAGNTDREEFTGGICRGITGKK